MLISRDPQASPAQFAADFSSCISQNFDSHKTTVFEILNYSKDRSVLNRFLSRRAVVDGAVELTVKTILTDVRAEGDKAVRRYTEKFDGVKLQDFLVPEKDIEAAVKRTDKKLLKILEQAAENLRRFHAHELEKSFFVDDGDGVTLGQKVTAIEKAALYVPAGQAAYPSSVLMNAIPALVAGVEKIYLTSPCDKHGNVHPYILAAAKVVGLKRIYKLGGAQAIAAFAFGTETVPKVYKITGPGNKFVATAKKLVFGEVSIDSVAGPSEIAVIADEAANPVFVTLDLFSQAEHDADASAVLITPSRKLAMAVKSESMRLLPTMKRKKIIEQAIINHSAIILTDSIEEACEVSNHIAPEHLEIQTQFAWDVLPKIRNAGAVFLGAYSSEPVGDYFAGPNHTLPTSSTAHFFSALSVKDFLKRTSIISYTKKRLEKTGASIAAFADAEGLDAHAKAVRARLNG